MADCELLDCVFMLGEENSLVSSEEEQSKSKESELNVVKALLAGVIKRRKNVRFADECGFCLESVQMIVRNVFCFFFAEIYRLES